MADNNLSEARKQKLTLQRARKRAAEELEARRLIEAAGTEPRQAKQKALADAQWLKGQTIRKRAPSPESESHTGDKSSVGTGRKKQKQQPDETEDSDTQAETAAKAKVIGKSGKGSHSMAATQKRRGTHKDLVPDSSGEEDMEGQRAPAAPVREERRQPLPKQVAKPPVKMARKEQDGDSSDRSFHASDEDDEAQSEEEQDYTKMSAAELVELMGNEAPAFPQEPVMDACALFDIDDADVEMSSARSSRSRHSSLGASLPPTSESDGGALDEIDEDKDDLILAPPLKTNPKRNKSGKNKREAKFRGERPSILSDEEHRGSKPVKKDRHHKISLQPHSSTSRSLGQDDDDEDDDEDQEHWPVHAQVRGTGLLQQNVYIRTVCRDAIKIAETTLVTDHAWPELNRMAEYRREVLRKAARTLLKQKKDNHYGDIYDRLKSDESFTKILGKWVLDRLPHTRGPVKASGINHIAVFQLGIGEACQARVKVLFEDDTYVYPGHWVDDDDGKPMWVVKAKDIYLNPALISILKEAFFDTPSAFGYKFKEYYVSSHPNSELSEKELTIPLVALAATGLYAGLYVWRDGVRDVKATKFEGDKYSSVFDLHKSYLLDLKEKNIGKFHAVMSELYAKVTNEPKSNNTTHKRGNPLSVMDLSGY